MLKLKFYNVLHRHNKNDILLCLPFLYREKKLKSQHSFYFRQTDS